MVWIFEVFLIILYVEEVFKVQTLVIAMKYNPEIHKRRSIRLKGYDYSQAGLYFITICCHGRVCRFGHIYNNKMILNENGIIAYNEWVKLAERFPNFELDVFQIMPNHFHGIIILNDAIAGAGFTPAPAPAGTPAPTAPAPAGTPAPAAPAPAGTPAPAPAAPAPMAAPTATATAPTISDIVGAYKSLVSNGCLKIYKSKNETMGKLWQRNYYEHIIRNEQAYKNISNYIINNPAKWQADKFHKK